MCQSIAALLVASICARLRCAILEIKFMLRARWREAKRSCAVVKEGRHRSAARRTRMMVVPMDGLLREYTSLSP